MRKTTGGPFGPPPPAGRGLSSLSVCTNRLKEGTEQSPNRPSLRSTDLDPTHVVLLHLLHLLLDRGVQLVLELERLHVVHVAVTVEEVAVKDGARLLLGVSRRLGLVLVVPVTAVPVGTGGGGRRTHRTGYSCTCGDAGGGADGLIVPVTAVPVGTRGADGLIVPVTAVPVGTRGAVPVTAVPVGTPPRGGFSWAGKRPEASVYEYTVLSSKCYQIGTCGQSDFVTTALNFTQLQMEISGIFCVERLRRCFNRTTFARMLRIVMAKAESTECLRIKI